MMLTISKPNRGGDTMQTQRIHIIDLDTARLEADLGATGQFCCSDAYSEFICGEWRSCMLWNKTGDVEDNFLVDYDRPARLTPYGARMPYLVEVLGQMFDLERLRFARLAKLTPGSVLVPHRDYLELKEDLTRVHIPLATDGACFSSEEDMVYQMRRGEIWYMDATQVHSAANFSRKPRTHLILDFTDVEHIEMVLRRPVYGPRRIPPENIVPRKPLGPGEREAFFSLARVIDPTNYRDVLTVLIKKFFTTDIAVAAVFDWLLEIARRSGNPEVAARVQWHHDHCLVKR
jgi:hypothetical protein